MDKFEIIQKILKESPEIDISKLVNFNEVYNLTTLCILNKKYLTKENLKIIVDNKLPIKKLNSKDKDQNELKYSNLALLISKYPDLLDNLNKKIIENLKIQDWVKIIQEIPASFDKCNKIDKLKFNDWIEILKKQPQLVYKYKNFYNIIDEYTLRDLAIINNEILNYIDIKRININKHILAKLVRINPKIIEKFDEDIMTKFNNILSTNWIVILQDQPQLINICNKINKIKDYNNLNSLINLVIKQPQFSYMLPSVNVINNTVSNGLNKLIAAQPELIEKLNVDIKSLSSYTIRSIIIKDINSIKKYKINFKIFNVEDWCKLLSTYPNLINKCDKLYGLDGTDWVEILRQQPILLDTFKEIINKRPTFKLSYYILNFKPELIEKLSEIIDFTSITELNFNNLVYNSKKYKIKFINKYIERFHNSEVLTNMIGIYPDLKELYTKRDLWKYVDFNQLTDNLEYGILK